MVGLILKKRSKKKGLGKTIGIWQSLTMKTRWKKKCNRELRVQNNATFLLLL